MSTNEGTKKYNIKVYVVEQLCRANEKYNAYYGLPRLFRSYGEAKNYVYKMLSLLNTSENGKKITEGGVNEYTYFDVRTETFRAGYRIKEDTLTVTGYDIEEVE